MTLRRLIAEPLVHFLLFGGALFLAYRLLNADAMQAPTTIVVAKAQVEALARQHESTWQRPPSDTELRGMVERWVMDEILYREGLSAGADRNDPVVRRRVVQKMQYLFEDMATELPAETELQAWLEAHRDTYRIAPVYSLEQVFLGEIPDEGRRQEAAARALSQLRAGGRFSGAVASVLPGRVEGADAGNVERTFGREFAQGLQGLPVGVWSGPVTSAYGSHVVRISRLDPERDPTLADVRQRVIDDVQRDRREKLKASLFDSLRERYTVEVEAGPTPFADAAAGPRAEGVPAAGHAGQGAP